MKRVKLKHGYATVGDNCSEEIINALNELSELAYKMDMNDVEVNDIVSESTEVCSCEVKKNNDGFWILKLCRNCQEKERMS